MQDPATAPIVIRATGDVPRGVGAAAERDPAAYGPERRTTSDYRGQLLLVRSLPEDEAANRGHAVTCLLSHITYR